MDVPAMDCFMTSLWTSLDIFAYGFSLLHRLWGVPSCCARQYHFVSLEKNWTEAQSYCRENYTDLAVIDSPEDNEQLLQTAGNPLQYAGWIGLYWDQWSWKWSMGNIRLDNRNGSDFTSWATGQPENYGGKENCGIMESRGLWHDYPCSCSFYFICYQGALHAAQSEFGPVLRGVVHGLPWLVWLLGLSRGAIRMAVTFWVEFACSVQVLPGAGLVNWCVCSGAQSIKRPLAIIEFPDGFSLHLHELLDFIPQFVKHKGSDAAGSYFLIETNKNFTAAQRSCREHHTDLASVRNRSENEEIRLTARGNYVWIGLFMEPWKWSSPSNPAFRNWADGVPDNAAGNEDCASLLMAGSSAGYWNGTGCDQRLPFFCFSEKKRVVMRVGLQLEKGKNPNEPGVRESLLNQMRGLLSKHTVMDRTSLKWKEQKDGLVFHPEKDKGQCDCRGDSAPV
nr:PREDICTED: uncharacterized protein LOC102699260 [Lepisosteus oculatus]